MKISHLVWKRLPPLKNVPSPLKTLATFKKVNHFWNRPISSENVCTSETVHHTSMGPINSENFRPLWKCTPASKTFISSKNSASFESNHSLKNFLPYMKTTVFSYWCFCLKKKNHVLTLLSYYVTDSDEGVINATSESFCINTFI